MKMFFLLIIGIMLIPHIGIAKEDFYHSSHTFQQINRHKFIDSTSKELIERLTFYHYFPDLTITTMLNKKNQTQQIIVTKGTYSTQGVYKTTFNTITNLFYYKNQAKNEFVLLYQQTDHGSVCWLTTYNYAMFFVNQKGDIFQLDKFSIKEDLSEDNSPPISPDRLYYREKGTGRLIFTESCAHENQPHNFNIMKSGENNLILKSEREMYLSDVVDSNFLKQVIINKWGNRAKALSYRVNDGMNEKKENDGAVAE